MESQTILNSKTIKILAKNQLVVIGLSIVYVCGLAALIMRFDTTHGTMSISLLIWILAFFPVIVFIGIWILVYIKLCGLPSTKNEMPFLRLLKKYAKSKECILFANIVKSNPEDVKTHLDQLEKISEQLSRICPNTYTSGSKNKIIWIDNDKTTTVAILKENGENTGIA
jgi:hypothetical protein